MPLVVRAPWLKGSSAGKRTDSLTELVDVMPTIASLAGLPPPAGVDGIDVSALLSDPAKRLKDAAYHQYPACGCKNSDPVGCYNTTRGACNNTPRDQFQFMGYSVRTQTWRYTVWRPWLGANGTFASDWSAPFAEELYDHTGDDSTDMDKYENENLASSQPGVAAQLHAQVRAFFEPRENKTYPHSTSVVDRSDPYDN